MEKKGQGTRSLSLKDQLPNCKIHINSNLYKLKDIVSEKKVIDIWCGFGWNQEETEGSGGDWLGVEPFKATDNPKIIAASAESLPFEDNTFDVAIMDAVLEHVPDVSKAFSEVGRVLKPGGFFIGYVAFMECFHEISYSHLSFKALEAFSERNDMELKAISGGSKFGIDYHLASLLYPVNIKFIRPFIASLIRSFIRLKSSFAYLALLIIRREPHIYCLKKANGYYKLSCLRYSNGFQFIIQKKIVNG